jgi:nitrous oxidase accessory protein
MVSTTAVAVAGEAIGIASGKDLQMAIASAAPGDVLRLARGQHMGPIIVDKSLTLIGDDGAVILGSGQGSVISITVPKVRIEGLTVRGSGVDVPAMDSGIFVAKTASGAEIINNHLEGNLFGVYLHGAGGSLVQANTIRGRSDLRMSEAGNGVSIWNAPGAEVIGNDIRYGRDGIFVNTSKNNLFRDNRFADLRFAIHYMYTHDSKVIGNVSRGNHVGWALMYSDRLDVRDNLSEGDRDHGLLLNYVNDSVVTGNVVRSSQKKCLFIYNAHRNQIAHNWFEGCSIGIHFTAGSEQNRVFDNAFISNQTQVKYVGSRMVEWTYEGHGNYWSDNASFDLDGDGIADRPYRPNDIVDDILWRYPQAKLLLSSPAVNVLRYAQSHLPALYPGGVVDTAPLMRPPSMSVGP